MSYPTGRQQSITLLPVLRGSYTGGGAALRPFDQRSALPSVTSHSGTLAQATPKKGLLVGPDASAGANRDARLRVLLSGWRVAASEVVRILRIACRSRTWELPLQSRRIKETKLDVLPVALRPTGRAAL
jgi:hypothetical protein